MQRINTQINKISNYFSQSDLYVFKIQDAICSGDALALKESLTFLLKSSTSFFDTAKESFYHGFVLGLLAIMCDGYRLSSNKESGKGRYDICLIPLSNKMPGVLIELKTKSDCSPIELKDVALEAINQIDEKEYDSELKNLGVTKILKYGLAFSGKNVEIEMKEESNS